MTKQDRNNQFFDVDLTNANLKGRAIRGGLFTMSSQAIESLLRIGSIAILARILIPEHFGLISMVTAITAIAERFQDLGLSTATVQKKQITHEEVSKLFWINVITGLGLTVVISSASFLIARFYHEQRLTYITIAIATGFLWSGLTIQHTAILRRQMKYAQIGSVQIGSTAISLAIAIILAVEGYGYWALVWREVLRNVFMALGTLICCPWIPGPPWKQIDTGHLLRFGRDITGFNAIVFLTASIPQILIGKLYGPAQLGIYRQAYQLIFSMVFQVVTPVVRVVEPTLSFLQDDAERYRRYYQKTVTTVNIVMMPLILFLAIYSHEIVLVMLGEK
ncbi:MAG TPA: lipopolysaccharide biosynthesis protein, partial [Candidatus Binatus sp.]|nr:lipopolysaccharide biosynthesis protein [Candidatus Binatus sp.]